MNKKTIFVILVIVVATGAALFWIYRESMFSKEILRLEILGPDTAKVGDEIEYTIKYKNNGNFALQNPPSKTILFIAEEVGLKKDFENTEEGIERLENIKELASLASRYDKMFSEEESGKNWERGVEKLLEDTSLVSDQDSDKKEKDGVRLMTVHASKGLEFAYVFVSGLE